MWSLRKFMKFKMARVIEAYAEKWLGDKAGNTKGRSWRAITEDSLHGQPMPSLKQSTVTQGSPKLDPTECINKEYLTENCVGRQMIEYTTNYFVNILLKTL